VQDVEPIRFVPKADLLMALAMDMPFTEALATWMEALGAAVETLAGLDADLICELADRLQFLFSDASQDGLAQNAQRTAIIQTLRRQRLSIRQISRLVGIPAMTLLRTISPRTHIGYLDCEDDLIANGLDGRSVSNLADQYDIGRNTVRVMAEMLGLGKAPTAKRKVIGETNAVVIEMRSAGMSVTEITAATGLGYRTIYRIANGR